ATEPSDEVVNATMPSVEDLPQTLLGLLPGNPLDAMVEGQMLQVVIFSIIVGIALVSMAPEKSRPMLDLLDSLQQVCMTVVKWAMRLAPFAVFGLMAQVYGIDLSWGSMALVVAMAVGASIGSPATPGVGIVILAMVLQTVGIPPSGIALIMRVDRILDMCRTAINVTGDLVTCRLMENWSGTRLPPEPAPADS
ncbi:MAG: cation:dicarboxylase symporter family transporter, partial [Marinobacter sp.]|uniref:dicarboxylate/amino acid:cation symporter n=1 Tax=Marinobacter sp. TaxID=50741 RepID=UPI00396E075B